MQLDLTPLATALERLVAGSVDLEPPSPVPIPPPAEAGALYLAVAGGVLRVGPGAVAALGALASGRGEDAAAPDRVPGADDADAVVELFRQSLGEVELAPSGPAPAGAVTRVALHVEPPGVSVDVFLIATAPAASPPPDTDAVPASAPGLPPGRPTAVLVDVDAAREAETRALLAERGWRLLDSSAPRAVLNWALVERVVDVIVLDPRWPRAAQLRQNLDGDERTRDLPLLAPTGTPAEIADAAEREAIAKRRRETVPGASVGPSAEGSGSP